MPDAEVLTVDEKELLQELALIEQVQKDRKHSSGIDYYIPNAAQLRCHQSKAKIILFVGGNRCIAGETLIYDPVVGKDRYVGEISEPFHVYAWTGEKLVVAQANTPFLKGFDALYRIMLSNGKHLLATSEHRILTPQGFLSVLQLQPGLSVCTPSAHQEYSHTRLGVSQQSQNLCESSEQSSLVSNHKSDRDLKSHSYQKPYTSFHQSRTISGGHRLVFSYHQQTNSELYQLAHALGGQRSIGTPVDSQYDCHYESRLYDAQFPLGPDIFQDVSPLPSDALSHNRLNSCEDAQDSLQECNHVYQKSDHLSNQRGQNLFCTPDDILPSDDTSKIVSIEFERYDYFYDFTVPLYHNYQDSSSMVSANSGKSTVGAAELSFHLTRNYPDWFPKERKFHRPIKAIVVCDANAKIEKVIEPKIREYLPKKYIAHKKTVGGYLNRIVCIDGSTVDFLSGEQDDMAFEGADWDFYWGDEPQKKRKFDAIMRGLIDRGGRTLLTFTPLIEPWMKETLVDQADGVKIEAFVVDTSDNLFDIKGNPILKQENIDEMMAMWDEETIESRIHGKFFHLRGTVYAEFCDVHQTRFEYQYPDPVICVMDPHDRQPHHIIWAVIDRTDDIHVHSEMSIHCTVSELAKKIRKLEKDNGYNLRRRIIDPNFGRKPLITTGRNMIEELCREGCSGWMEADDAKDEGHLKVKEYLHFQRNKPISEVNKPKLFFHKERVPKTIHSIKNYQYEEWVGKIAGERDPKEMPKQKETHGADVIRYLCMTNPRYEFLRYRHDYELESAAY